MGEIRADENLEPIKTIDDFSFTYIEVGEDESSNNFPYVSKQTNAILLKSSNIDTENIVKFSNKYNYFINILKEIYKGNIEKEYYKDEIEEIEKVFHDFINIFKEIDLDPIFMHDISCRYGRFGNILSLKSIDFELNDKLRVNFNENDLIYIEKLLFFSDLVYGCVITHLGKNEKSNNSLYSIINNIKKCFDIFQFNKNIDCFNINNKTENLIININNSDFIFLVINIIKNAYVHGNANEIEINIFEKKGNICFEILDNGEGINKKLFPNIDDIFKYGSSDGKGNSKGLGLENSIQRMKKNNGKIEAFYNEGINNNDSSSGAKFLITFNKDVLVT